PLIAPLATSHTRKDMVLYARALDRDLQWGYYMIPNYYTKGTPLVFANRFGMHDVATDYDDGLETCWQISTTPFTNDQA
ncbi:ABC transporter substrate-binding protein, partial [Pseudomonas syringae pv. tagetis]